MTAYPADVQVCLPGRGCVYYVPGEGQALNAAVAIGSQVLDGFLVAVLGALVLVGVVAGISAVRSRAAGDRVLPGRSVISIAAVLLIAGGVVVAVPAVVSSVAPVAEVFGLSSSSCVGVALLVLAGRLPHPARAALVVAGVLWLLLLPVGVLQFVLAAPFGSFPSGTVTELSQLVLAVAGVVVFVMDRGSGTIWCALLLPPVVTLLTGIRLGLPFPADRWIDLLPSVASMAAGLLVLASRPSSASPVRAPRRATALLGGTAVALAMTVTVVLAWPTSSPGAPTAGGPAIGPVRVVTAATPLLLPLDDYRQSSKDRDLVLRAENTLIRACAARQTVTVQAVDLLPAETPESSFSLLGLIGEQQAGTDGYWTPRPPDSSGGVQSDGDLRVLADCVSTARTRLGDDGTAQQLVRQTAFTALARTDADSRVQRLQAAWSRCIQRRGFVHATPMELALTQATTFPSPGDTRAASASVACEKVTNLPGVRAAALAAYEKRAIEGDGTRLTAARATLLAQEQKASTILRGESPQ